MIQEREQEILELMDDITDDLRKRRPKTGNQRNRPPSRLSGHKGTILIALGALLVFILILVLFFRDNKGPSSEDLAALQSRISQLDERLGHIEGLTARMDRLDKESEGARQSLEKIEEMLKDLKGEISENSRKYKALAKKEGSSGQAPGSSDSSVPSKRYHTVRQGDTLYGIAKKYGLTINDLRRLNKDLAKNRPIVPGQKLLVGG